jgi:hypothetical protein
VVCAVVVAGAGAAAALWIFRDAAWQGSLRLMSRTGFVGGAVAALAAVLLLMGICAFIRRYRRPHQPA